MCAAGLALAIALAPAAPAHAADAVLEPPVPPATAAPEAGLDRGQVISLAAVGGFHLGLSTWAYFAWYHDTPDRPFRVGGDGLFGRDTYAGGADKLGHLWTGNMIGRVGSEVLIAGGWEPLPASLIASGLGFFLLGLVEVKDGYHTEFSPGDLAGNLAGSALSVLLVNVPAADEAIDFRVEYVPSPLFRRSIREAGDVDVANDYSGQRYLLAFHLKSLEGLVDRRGLGWARFVDLVAGFEARGYLPAPADEDAPATQRLFLGAALDLQHVLEVAFGRGEGRPGAGQLVFEFLSPPYTTLPAVDATRGR